MKLRPRKGKGWSWGHFVIGAVSFRRRCLFYCTSSLFLWYNCPSSSRFPTRPLSSEAWLKKKKKHQGHLVKICVMLESSCWLTTTVHFLTSWVFYLAWEFRCPLCPFWLIYPSDMCFSKGWGTKGDNRMCWSLSLFLRCIPSNWWELLMLQSATPSHPGIGLTPSLYFFMWHRSASIPI